MRRYLYLEKEGIGKWAQFPYKEDNTVQSVDRNLLGSRRFYPNEASVKVTTYCHEETVRCYLFYCIAYQ